MRRRGLIGLSVVALIAIGGCGGDEEPAPTSIRLPTTQRTAPSTQAEPGRTDPKRTDKKRPRTRAEGPTPSAPRTTRAKVKSTPKLRACLRRAAKRGARRRRSGETPLEAASECLRRHSDLEVPEPRQAPAVPSPDAFLDPAYLECVQAAGKEPDEEKQRAAIDACQRKLSDESGQ